MGRASTHPKPTRLIDVGKDGAGRRWGLIASPVLGSSSDLWIARHDGRRWVEPLFTGLFCDELEGDDWVSRFVADPELRRDSDGDGWTDLVEKRLGTHPLCADTDGDGVADPEDPNPLCARAPATDEERVLAAAFEARFLFDGRGVPLLVRMPEGVDPFALNGWDWVVVAARAGEESMLASLAGQGRGSVSFGFPGYFAGKEARRRPAGDTILWSADRSEAHVAVAAGFGGLDASGCEVHLRCFDGEWFAVGVEETWIS